MAGLSFEERGRSCESEFGTMVRTKQRKRRGRGQHEGRVQLPILVISEI